MIILEIANVNASIMFPDLLTIDEERGMIPEGLFKLAKEKLVFYRLIEIPQLFAGEILLRDRGIVSHFLLSGNPIRRRKLPTRTMLHASPSA